MKTWVSGLLALVLVAACGSSAVHPAYRLGDASTVRIDLTGGTCTAVIIARSSLLTAAHCFKGMRRLVGVDGEPATGRIVANDGRDHVIVRVDRPLEGRIAPIRLLGPMIGEDLYLWGNPSPFRHQMRRGYMTGTYKGYLVFDIQSWYGDSGGAVYDAHGRVVAIVTGGIAEASRTSDGVYQVMVAHPLRFSRSQIALVTR